MKRYQIDIEPRTLHFKRPAGTSRGVYTTRRVHLVHLSDPNEPGRVGIGECAPLPQLSRDDLPDYEERLAEACARLAESGELDVEALRPYPSILFGLETALTHFHAGSLAFHDTPFSRGEAGIPIRTMFSITNQL